MAHTKPVYVFVGGVSHTPAFFEDLIQQMTAHGYESTAVAFPTCGDNTENVKQWDEVTAIQDAVSSCLDGKNQDVVLVLHSYGGWPAAEPSRASIRRPARTMANLQVLFEVVFLTAFLLPDNAPIAQYSYLPPWLTVEARICAPSILSPFFLLTSRRTAAASRMSRPSPFS